MKPISKLKLYQSATTSIELLKAFLKLTNNPKRHIRGPMTSSSPGNGKNNQWTNGYGCTEKDAVSACALGALIMLSKPGHNEMRIEAENKLSATCFRLYPGKGSFVGVSDQQGLKAIRRVVNETLKDLQTT